MTPKQTSLYWREWNRARHAGGLTEDDRDVITVKVLGQRVSSKDLTNRQLDAVLAGFRAVSKPGDLDTQVKAMNQPRDRALWRIGWIAQCLGLYLDDVPGYIATITAAKIRAGADGAWDLSALDDRPRARLTRSGLPVAMPSELDQILMTLTARLHHHRREHHHTIHEMATLAGARCWCAPCKREREQSARPRCTPAARVAEVEAEAAAPVEVECPF